MLAPVGLKLFSGFGKCLKAKMIDFLWLFNFRAGSTTKNFVQYGSKKCLRFASAPVGVKLAPVGLQLV